MLGSADAVMAQQSSDEVRVLGRTRVRSGALPAQLGPVREAVLIRRLRLDEGVPVSYAENYLQPRACGPGQRRGPGARPGHQDPPRRAVAAAAQDRQRGLGPPRPRLTWPRCCEIDALTPVLVSENVTYAAGATPVDVARIYYRGDRFTFAISLDIP